MKNVPANAHKIGIDAPLSQKNNMDSPYLDTAYKTLKDTPGGNQSFQKFRTAYNQMMMPISMRQILPKGLIGLFCLLMIILLLSTDDTRIINAANAITQDLIVPFQKESMSPKNHLLCLRLVSLGVALFFLTGSLVFSQIDYIVLALQMLIGIWLGGCGPVIIFGLYSKFGNTQGAYSSIFVGSGISISGIFFQRCWASHIYPFLEACHWADPVGNFLNMVSSPFSPYIVWNMNPVKFPINAYEIFFFAMVFSTIAYIGVSLLTSRKKFDLDCMLHRGKYAPAGEIELKTDWSLHGILKKLLGITPEYTTGDKILTWSVLIWSLGFKFGICFLAVIIWNAISPWTIDMWNWYFFGVQIAISMVLAVVTMFWFGIGGVRDILQMFRDLAKRIDNPLDNGRVEDHVSISEPSSGKP